MKTTIPIMTKGSDAECYYIQLTPSNYISIFWCAFLQEKDDWRRTVIFHTFIKIGDKNWKVKWIVEIVSMQYRPKWLRRLDGRLNLVPIHKVSSINSTTLDVKQQCLVPIDFDVYKGKIWCDVVTMDVGQIILGSTTMMLPFMVDQTCVDLSTRIRRLSWHPTDL